MTACLLAAFSSLAVPCHSLKPASKSELILIEGLLKDARTLTPQIKSAADDLERVRRPIEPKQHLVQKHQTALGALKRRQESLMLDAINRTLIVFDIVPAIGGVPRMPSGISVVPGFEGHRRTWTIRYGRELVDLPVMSNNGPISNPPPGPRDKARITPDGVTIIWGDFVDPRFLASLLLHERRHFEQFTTAGVGDLKTRPDWEVDAYGAEQRAIGPFGFWKDPAFEAYLTGFLRDRIQEWVDVRDKSPYERDMFGNAGSASIPRPPPLAPSLPVPDEVAPVLPPAPAAPAEVDDRQVRLAPAPAAADEAPERPVPPSEPLPLSPDELRPPPKPGYYDPCIEPGRSCLK